MPRSHRRASRQEPLDAADDSTNERAQRTIIFQKTKMCKFHILGACSKGSGCKFAHQKEELCAPPDLSCTKLCKTLISTGSCNDPECSYAHNRDELREMPGVDNSLLFAALKEEEEAVLAARASEHQQLLFQHHQQTELQQQLKQKLSALQSTATVPLAVPLMAMSAGNAQLQASYASGQFVYSPVQMVSQPELLQLWTRLSMASSAASNEPPQQVSQATVECRERPLQQQTQPKGHVSAQKNKLVNLKKANLPQPLQPGQVPAAAASTSQRKPLQLKPPQRLQQMKETKVEGTQRLHETSSVTERVVQEVKQKALGLSVIGKDDSRLVVKNTFYDLVDESEEPAQTWHRNNTWGAGLSSLGQEDHGAEDSDEDFENEPRSFSAAQASSQPSGRQRLGLAAVPERRCTFGRQESEASETSTDAPPHPEKRYQDTPVRGEICSTRASPQSPVDSSPRSLSTLDEVPETDRSDNEDSPRRGRKAIGAKETAPSPNTKIQQDFGVVIKNTFLEIDDHEPPSKLRVVRTAGGRLDSMGCN
jgi:hypothetical protein